MLKLPESAKAWPSQGFDALLKAEIERLPVTELPLQQGLTQGSFVADAPCTVTVLGCREQASTLVAKVGVLFTSLLPGCNCADDPSPPNDYPEYCELEVRIDLHSATATARVSD